MAACVRACCHHMCGGTVALEAGCGLVHLPGVSHPLLGPMPPKAKQGVLVHVCACVKSAWDFVCVQGGDVQTYWHRCVSKVCGGCDLTSDQCFSKRIPGPSRTRKLGMFCCLELCSSCSDSVYMTSYSNLRMPLRALCFRDDFLSSAALPVPVTHQIILYLSKALHCCLCCLLVRLTVGKMQLVATVQLLVWLRCITGPVNVFWGIPYVAL